MEFLLPQDDDGHDVKYQFLVWKGDLKLASSATFLQVLILAAVPSSQSAQVVDPNLVIMDCGYSLWYHFHKNRRICHGFFWWWRFSALQLFSMANAHWIRIGPRRLSVGDHVNYI